MPETANPKGTKGAEEITPAADNTALDNFEWDDNTESADFFGVAGSATSETEEVVPPVKTKKKAEKPDLTPPAATKTKEEEEEVAEEDVEFFGIKTETNAVTGEVTATEVEEEEEQEDYYRTLSSKMKENGIFQNIEIPEDEEITEEKFIELQDNEIELRVEEAFEGFFSELDTDAAAFLKHKKEGGSTQDFFKVYGQHTGTPKGDLDDEKYQERLSRYFYKLEGDDPEDIDDKIEWLKDSGKLEKYAQKFDTKIKENDKKSKEDLKTATADAEKIADVNKKKFSDSVQEALDNVDKVDNFKFTAKSKKSLFPFITKPSVKVGKNRYITPMQSKLGTALKDPEKLLVLAQLLENDFDLSNILADVETRITKGIKKDIQRQKSGVKPQGSGRVNKKKSLSDFF